MASTVITPISIIAEAINMRSVIGSPIKITPAAEPNTPDVDKSIATWVADVYFCATVCMTRVSANPIVAVCIRASQAFYGIWLGKGSNMEAAATASIIPPSACQHDRA